MLYRFMGKMGWKVVISEMGEGLSDDLSTMGFEFILESFISQSYDYKKHFILDYSEPCMAKYVERYIKMTYF
jgi:hypothetical protein